MSTRVKLALHRALTVAAGLTAGVAVSGLTAERAEAQACEATPFACAVDNAINQGLFFLRNAEQVGNCLWCLSAPFSRTCARSHPLLSDPRRAGLRDP